MHKVEKNRLAKEREFWLKTLSSNFKPTQLNVEYKKINSYGEYALSKLDFKIPVEITKNIVEVCNNSDPMLHIYLTTCLKLLIYYYNSDDEIQIGTAVDKQEEDSVFINTLLPLKSQIKNNQTFKELLLSVRDTINNAIDNQNYPVSDIVKELNVDNADNNKLFDIAIILQNIHDVNYILPHEPNLIFSFNRNDVFIEGSILFNKELFKNEIISKIGNHFNNLLKTINNNYNIKISDIEILDQKEKELILFDFNNTDSNIPVNTTLFALISESAEKYPDKIALIDKDQFITYAELKARAGAFGKKLYHEHNINKSIVGVLSYPSIELVISVLGILYTNSVYVPINPEFPEDNIKYILTDCNMQLLLVNEDALSITDNLTVEKLIVNKIIKELDFEKDYIQSDISNDINANVYIIYTSGSTGRPKGVLVNNASILNQLLGLMNNYEFKPQYNHILLAPITFDPSIQQIFLPLISGGKLNLIHPEVLKNIELLSNYICERQIDIINTVPSIMNVLVRQSCIHEMNFAMIILAGEKFTINLFHSINNSLKYKYLYNIYGPTEATINSTLSEVTENDILDISIGKPLTNYKIAIVNTIGKLLPVGFIGEICIAGKGLAEGYINQPDLTFDKFEENNIFENFQRFYKTGDLGYWRKDGQIGFVGREDNQVKLSGQRVELGEIEFHLKRFDAHIKDVVVTIRNTENQEKQLIAYYVSAVEFERAKIVSYLLKKLPQYMIPQHFICLDQIPLSINGKIDFAGLPMPINNKKSEGRSANHIEEKLVKIWAQVLQIEKNQVGVNTNFFDFGGNSLNATTLLAKINKEFQIKLPLTNIFMSPTPGEFSKYIISEIAEEVIEIKNAEKKEYYPTLPSQQSMYSIYCYAPESCLYNITSITNITGEVDFCKLENAFNKLIAKHESLRTSFHAINNQLVQRIQDKLEVEITTYQSDSLIEDHNIIKEFIKPFDLTAAPLIRIGFIKKSKEQGVLVIDMHHIIADGVSVNVLRKDLSDFYNKESNGTLNEIQIKDYAVWFNQNRNIDLLQNQRKYWYDEFSNPIKDNDLFTEQEKNSDNIDGKVLRFNIDVNYNSIRKIILKESTTLFIYFLTIYNILLSKLSKSNDIVIGTPVAGRKFDQLETVVGNLVNTMLIRSTVNENVTFKQLLDYTKDKVLRALDNQDIHYKEILDHVKKQNSKQTENLFHAFFAVENMEINDLDFKNLVLEPYEYAKNLSKFNICLNINEEENGINFSFEYSNHKFKESSVNYFKECLESITSQVVENINIVLQDIKLKPNLNDNILVSDYMSDFEF